MEEFFLSHRPKYDYETFRKACGKNKGKKVNVWENAAEDAERLFRKDEEALLDFIYKKGFDSITFFNSSPHRNIKGVFIDEYEFRTGGITGYIAFFKVNENWSIKSFHQSETRFTLLGDEIKKLKEKKVLK